MVGDGYVSVVVGGEENYGPLFREARGEVVFQFSNLLCEKSVSMITPTVGDVIH